MKKLKMFNLLLFSLLIGRGLNAFSLPVKAEAGQENTIKVSVDQTEVSPGDTVIYTFVLDDIYYDTGEVMLSVEYPENMTAATYSANENFIRSNSITNNTGIFNYDGVRGYDEITLLTVSVKISEEILEETEIQPNITAYYKDYSSNLLPCSIDLDSARVTVTPPEPEKPTEIPAVAVTLTESSLTLNTGDISTIYATIEPANSTDERVWDSSVPLVATVENGTITAHKAGETTITARRGDVSASCLVTVLCKHEYEHIDSTATCLSEGVAEHYRCSKCGELFDTEKKHTDLQQLKEEKTEHNYSDLTNEVAATCETEGTKAHYTCKNCGTVFDTNKEIIENRDLIIPMTGHKYGRWKTDETSHWRECTNPECEKTTDKQEHICDNVPCESKKF